jgi:hypothetical protein
MPGIYVGNALGPKQFAVPTSQWTVGNWSDRWSNLLNPPVCPVCASLRIFARLSA